MILQPFPLGLAHDVNHRFAQSILSVRPPRLLVSHSVADSTVRLNVAVGTTVPVFK